MPTVYHVMTNLNPEKLTKASLEIYKKWLSFCLGATAIGGFKLKYPSGKMAQALQWKRTGVARISVLISDNKEAEILETGYEQFSIKEKMLAKFCKVGRSRGGALFFYRVIPIAKPFEKWNKDNKRYDSTMRVPLETMAQFADVSEKEKSKIKGIWVKGVKFNPKGKKKVDFSKPTRFVTMRSDSPGWLIPGDKPRWEPYSPARILSELLNQKSGNPMAGGIYF